MQSLAKYLLLGAAGLTSVLGSPQLIKRAPIDDYISYQTPISLERVLCNIGPDGCEVAGEVPAGIGIASPSRYDPTPYFFTWTRDSGLVFKNLAERFSNNYDTTLQKVVQDYVVSQARLQGVSNPSGGLADGQGLAEPKFEVDFRAYTGPWGRPQRDGPALRAIAIMQYVKWLIKNGYGQTAADVCWPVVRNDLMYIAQYWTERGFDLWEEVNGESFFTFANQHRAMVEGAYLARQLKSESEAANYEAVAPHILCKLQEFWDSGFGAVRANINHSNDRTDLDANTLLGSIHTFDPELGCDSTTFQPCSDRMLANHKRVTDSMRVWGINNGIPSNSAPAIGRYVRDVYIGGNPWYLTTFAAAEVLYDAVYVWEKQGSVQVTSLSQDFFRALDGNIGVGTYNSGSSEFNNIISKVRDYADSYMLKNRQYTPEGRMAEQYDKNNGEPKSARDLTWSYASFLTAAAARAGEFSETHGWVYGTNPSLPGSCSRPTRQGNYGISEITDWPASITEGGGSETITGPPPVSDNTGGGPGGGCVTVWFKAKVITEWGDTVKVAGDVTELGEWDPNRALALNADKYEGDHNPHWEGSVGVTEGARLRFKLLKTTANGDVFWEGGDNYEWYPPGGCGTNVDYVMYWRFP